MSRACADVELERVDATIEAGVAGDRGFYYVEDDSRAVGRALRWAEVNGLATIEVLATGGTADLARRAAFLGDEAPAVSVWQVEGATAIPAVPAPAPTPPEIPAEHRALAGLITEAGARPVDDHGVLVAEVAGLEVARVVDGPDGPVLDVGVGHADRELNQMVHAGADPVTDLRRVIAAVGDYRLRQSHHPLARVGRERWLRSMCLDEPGLVGAATLEPIVPLRRREGLRAAVPSPAAGTTADGRPVVVVAMVGIDLDLVPEAADYRHRHDPEAELVVVMPERDLALSAGALERLTSARAVVLAAPWAGASH